MYFSVHVYCYGFVVDVYASSPFAFEKEARRLGGVVFSY